MGKRVSSKCSRKRDDSAERLCVGHTGAHDGDVLVGHGDAEGALIRVHGHVPASSYYTLDDQEALVRAIAVHFGLGHDKARMKAHDIQPKDVPNHLPIGSGCVHHVTADCFCPGTARLEVLSQGRIHQWAKLHGHSDELDRIVAEGRLVEWRDVLNLCRTPHADGGRLLLLRLSNFSVLPGPCPLVSSPSAVRALLTDEAEGPCFDLSRGEEPSCAAVVLPTRFDGKVQAASLLSAAFPGEEPAELCKVLDTVGRLTDGQLKSLMQKTIRFGASHVDFGAWQAPAGMVTAAAVASLFASKGTFSAECQMFTSGPTSALKRLAIVLVEDAWVHGAEARVRSLLLLALACQRVHGYVPSHSTMVAAVTLASEACDSPLMLAWRDPAGKTRRPADPAVLGECAELLRIVRSFEGDMVMFEKVAKLAEAASLPVHERTGARPARMPIVHMVDHHCWRGIGHVLTSPLRTFARRFDRIFNGCTGVNSRQGLDALFEERNVDIREAQGVCLRFTLGAERTMRPHTGETQSFRLDVSPGVLAAGVGPIRMTIGRRHMVVLLGTMHPDELVVMLQPSRDDQDLFGDVTEQERCEAGRRVRSRTYTFASPALPGRHKVTCDAGTWWLGDQPWSDVVERGLRIELPVLASSETLDEAVGSIGTGAVHQVREAVEKLVGRFGVHVSLRAASLVSKQWTTVRLPVPGLHGELANEQLAAYSGDWDVWHMLMLLSTLMPSALRPRMPPDFDVPDALALRALESMLTAAVRRVTAMDGTNEWPMQSKWADFATRTTPLLMEHQRAAVEAMIQRDQCADLHHFVVMDTGLGKTLTSLWYGYQWLSKLAGAGVVYMLWVTPKGTLDNLCRQLTEQWGVPTTEIKRPPKGEAPAAQRFCVNVVHADLLRSHTAFFAEIARQSFVIFDEVDQMYAPTQRTSAARQMALLCPKYVAQTATPMTRNAEHLRTWLADTCAFPVTHENLLVAAGGMVAMQLELGIQLKATVVKVPMSAEVRQAARALDRQWLKMATCTQGHTDAAMVDEAVHRALVDRVTHPEGGVLLVADTARHAELLREACSLRVRTGDFDSLEAADAGTYAVVVVTKDKCRGYNSAVRLGSVVTGAYAGSGASRHQLSGRIRRIGQVRTEVQVVTVIMSSSILELLHERHSAVDTMNITLEQLGQRFRADVLGALGGL